MTATIERFDQLDLQAPILAALAEIGGRERPAPSFYWQRHGAGAANAAGFGLPGPTAECHCPKSWGRF